MVLRHNNTVMKGGRELCLSTVEGLNIGQGMYAQEWLRVSHKKRLSCPSETAHADGKTATHFLASRSTARGMVALNM